MFNWLTEDADYRFQFKVNLRLYEFDFYFAFYNIEFTFNLPLPFPCVSKYFTLFNKNILSPFSKSKEADNTHKRWWEIEGYYSSDLETNLTISIPLLRDHDNRVFSISLLGLGLNVQSYHNWHLCRCKSNLIERFPTDEECKEHLEFSDKICKKYFGNEHVKYSELNEQDKIIYDEMCKIISEHYNNIPANDEVSDD